jgi:tripartite motif-containing protein 71
VADTGNARVLKQSAAGATVLTIGAKGSAPGEFVEPAGVAEGADGTLYVADVGNSRAQSFTAAGKPLAQWPVGPSIARDGVRVAADGAGVLVAQTEARAIVRYDAQGHEQGRWVFRPSSATFTPSGLTPLGDGRFIALFLGENAAAVFAAGK